MDASSGELLDAQEMLELEMAIALSLEEKPAASSSVVQKSFQNAIGRFGVNYESIEINYPLVPHKTDLPAARGLKKRTSTQAFKGKDMDWEERKAKRRADIAEEIRKLDRSIKVKPPLFMRFPTGALRITRTPGRKEARTPNTISLEELIHPEYLDSAMIFAFFIENDHLFQFLPFKGTTHCRSNVDIYIGRDLSMDGQGKNLAGFEGKTPKGADFDRVSDAARVGYRRQYGENFHAFYPRMQSGCAHTKWMLLVYPEFLRVVITSANLMQSDTVFGDNVWYIQDFPRLYSNASHKQTRFEVHLRQHVQDLQCPPDFLSDHLTPGEFDFSQAQVHLVTSKPGSFSGDDTYKYGQLRLRDVLHKKVFKNEERAPKRLEFEICVGSIGLLDREGIVKNFLESCSGGLRDSIEGKPNLKIIFPTYQDVQESSGWGKSNISSHMDWNALEEHSAEYLRTVFHHYRSKDPRCLFHSKIILAFNSATKSNRRKPPVYMYLGSANFSAGAWGKVEPERRSKVQAEKNVTMRLEKVANFECGVVILGKRIEGMLEKGSHWEDIIPYERPTERNRYKEGERPWKVPKENFEAAATPMALDWEVDTDDVDVDSSDDDKEGEDEGGDEDNAMHEENEDFESDTDDAEEEEDERLARLARFAS
ncbi:phospholipase D/nuclease [Favolaschia claudopus]|uniref:Phospholipase D/nuclease n=1 Tax=Favolaschia claudopus TaxID=2862362 RepID=A0AAW0AG86_9AGAR